jgi:hypothetical protein
VAFLFGHAPAPRASLSPLHFFLCANRIIQVWMEISEERTSRAEIDEQIVGVLLTFFGDLIFAAKVNAAIDGLLI